MLQHRNKIIDLIDKLRCFRRGHPFGPQPFFFHAAEIQHLRQDRHPFLSGIITVQVIAFTLMSPAHKNAVRPLLKRFEHVMGGYAPGACDPDDTHIGRVLHTTDPSQVSSGIRSPVAQECDDKRFELRVAHIVRFLV